MPNNDSYYNIKLPTGETYQWDDDQYDKAGDKLFQQYPGVEVKRVVKTSPDMDINDDDTFKITLDSGDVYEWDANQYRQAGAKLRAQYPTAQVYRTINVNNQRDRDFARQYEFARKHAYDTTLTPGQREEYKSFADTNAARYGDVAARIGATPEEENLPGVEPITAGMSFGGGSRGDAGMPRRRERAAGLETFTGPQAMTPEDYVAREQEQPTDSPIADVNQMEPEKRSWIRRDFNHMVGTIGNAFNEEMRGMVRMLGGKDDTMWRDAYTEFERRLSSNEPTFQYNNVSEGALSPTDYKKSAAERDEKRRARDINDLINDLRQEALDKGVDPIEYVRERLSNSRAMKDALPQKIEEETTRLIEENEPSRMGGLLTMGATTAGSIALAATGHYRGAAALGEATLATFAQSAAGASIQQAKAAGATDDQALVSGLASGAIMYAFSKIPIGKFIRNATPQAVTTAVRRAVSNAPRGTINEELNKLLTDAAKRGVVTKGFEKEFAKEFAKGWGKNIAESTASFASMSAVSALVPLIYEDPDNYPVLSAVLQSALHGAEDGLIMGTFAGGFSNAAQFYNMTNRWRGRGEVVLAEVNPTKAQDVVAVFNKKTGQWEDMPNFIPDGQSRFAEVIGKPNKDIQGGMFTVRMDDGSIYMVTEDAISVARTFDPLGLREAADAFRQSGYDKAQLAQSSGDPAARAEVKRNVDYASKKAEQERQTSGNVSEETQLDLDRANEMQQGRRDVIRQQMEETLGQPFYEPNSEGRNVVRTIILPDGETAYIVASNTDGFAYVDAKGNKGTISRADAGEVTAEFLEDHLDGMLAMQDGMSEQERMAAETANNLAEVQQRFSETATANGGRINIGTPEQEVWGTVTGINPAVDGGVSVLVEGESAPRVITWDKIADQLDMQLQPKSDEQIVNDRIENDRKVQEYNGKIKKETELYLPNEITGENDMYRFLGAYTDEDGNILFRVRENETGAEVEVLPETIVNLPELMGETAPSADVSGNPVPTTPTTAEPTQAFTDPVANQLGIDPKYATTTSSGNVVVDGGRLWADDPETWAKWNDANPNRTVGTKEYLESKLQDVNKAVARAESNLRAEVMGAQDPNKIETLTAARDAISARQRTLEGLITKYDVAETNAAEEALAQVNEQAEVPVDQAGAKQYGEVTPERAFADLAADPNFTSPEEVSNFIDGKIKRAQKALEKAQKAADKIKPENYDTPAEYRQAKDAELAKLQPVQNEYNHWLAVREASLAPATPVAPEPIEAPVVAPETVQTPAVPETPVVPETPAAEEPIQVPEPAAPAAPEQSPTPNADVIMSAIGATPKEISIANANTRIRDIARRNTSDIAETRRIELMREKAKALQTMFDELSSENTVVSTREDILGLCKKDGISERYLNDIEEALETSKANGVRFRGLYGRKGRVYILADDVLSAEDASEAWEHENKHRKNDITGAPAKALLTGVSEEEMKDALVYLTKSHMYDKANAETLADEILANAAEIAESMGEDAVSGELRRAGIKNEKFITFVEKNIKDGRAQHNTSPGRNEIRNGGVGRIPRQNERDNRPGDRRLDRQGDRPAEEGQRGTRRGDESIDTPDENGVPYSAKREITAALGGQTEDGSPIRFSVTAVAEGAGLAPVRENSRGDVAFRGPDGTEFSGHNKITAEYLKSIPNTVLGYMMADAKAIGTVTPQSENIIWQLYSDVLNAYLEKGLAENGGFENLATNWQWIAETVYKAVATNSDTQYSYSQDITRVCKKNEAVIKTIAETQRRLGYGLTPGQIMDIYLASEREGYQVPCPVCYVFSRYIRNGQYATIMINGQRKYGSQLVDPSTLTPEERQRRIRYWQRELRKQKANNTLHANAIKSAKADIQSILDEIDKLGMRAIRAKEGSPERERAMQRIYELDERYKAALQVVSQAGLDGWITNFAIHKVNNKWELYDDSFQGFPEEMALDLRETATVMQAYPAIQRYRNTRGAAAGKEITFEANNDLGEVPMMLGVSNLKEAPNYYKLAVEAKDEETRKKMLAKASERFRKAHIYMQRQTLRGGQRMWSWSDNIERLAPDVFINMLQDQMLGGGVQAYSKQLEGIKLVATLQGYVNGSLMGKGIGYREVGESEIERVGDKLYLRDGDFVVAEPGKEPIIIKAPVYESEGKYYTLEFDDVVGIDAFGKDENGKHFKGLFELNQSLDKAGNILVGMNDIHVRAAMADDRVFFIIPWHSSGGSVHILRQMLGYLNVNLDNFNPQDYTNVQEEKRSEKVSKALAEFWEAHKNETDFRCGIKGGIPSGKDGKLSPQQIHYKELRDAILVGQKVPTGEKDKDGNPKYKFVPVERNAQWMREIMDDEFLSQAYRKVRSWVDDQTMTNGDTGFIYPYEYWDENSTYDTADINGARYLEYTRRMGYKPKFCGTLSGNAEKDFGNFADDHGYWKLLIDRRMYDTQGRFQDLTPVNTDNFTPDLVDPEETAKEFKVTRVADDAAAGVVADRVIEREEGRPGGIATVDYGLTLDEAVQTYNEVLERRGGERSISSAQRAEFGRFADQLNEDFPDSSDVELASQSDEDNSPMFSVTAKEDADYMAAAERGDVETAREMVRNAFKRAFPNTQVVDENGEPKILYHGTNNEFTKFNPAERGLWFTEKMYAENYGDVLMPVFLNAENLGRIEDKNDWREKGYDGWVDMAGPYRYFTAVVADPSQVKSAEPITRDDDGNIIPLSERFNPEEGDIRFSFVGEKGVGRLDEAEETSIRMDNLAVAKRMSEENVDAKNIKLATGWEKGADGKWRYEIPDVTVKKEIFDIKPGKGVKLSDIIKPGSDLLKAYPELGDFIVKRSRLKGAWGNLVYDDKTIAIDLTDISKYIDEWGIVKEVILHELQHAVQHMEGFAAGGALTPNDDTPSVQKAKKERPATYRMITFFRNNSMQRMRDVGRMKVMEYLNDIYKGARPGYSEEMKRMAADLFRDLYRMSDYQYSELVRDMAATHQRSKWEQKDIYNRLAGEVEARNVESRMKLKPEERRNSLASETEDVARGRQIVRFSITARSTDDAYNRAAQDWNNSLRMETRRSEREGVDYYPTPQYLSYKMGEWLGIEPGMSFLEPSAGDGRNGAYLPAGVSKTMVEQSPELSGRIPTDNDTEVVTGDFMEFPSDRKFDREIINPPFGRRGETAAEHIAKAFSHLAEGGRMIALIPANRRTDRAISDIEAEGGHVAAVMTLPKSTFYKAGIHGTFEPSLYVIDRNGEDSPALVYDFSGMRTQELFDALDAVKDIPAESPDAMEQEESQIRYSLVSDQALIDKFESEPKRTYYRALQLIDGKFYPPMAAMVDGKMVDPIPTDRWEQADERPDLAIPDVYTSGPKKGQQKTYADGSPKYVFNLDKGQKDARGKKSNVKAAYNPYIHSSNSPLNDQFSSAWARPNLVMAKVEVPESEATSGYRAEKAKDSVGEKAWKSGPVSNALRKAGKPERKVFLSRYDKPVGFLTNEEAADEIAKTLEGVDIAIPFNTVSPGLRDELVKRGIKIGPPEKGNAGEAAIPAYEEWLKDNGGDRGPDGGGPRYSLTRRQREQVRSDNFKNWFGDWENDPENASKVVDERGFPAVVYHQTNGKVWINKETGEDWETLSWEKRDEWAERNDWDEYWEERDFNTFDNRYSRQNVEVPGFFFAPNEDPYHEYGDRTIAAYLNIKNPAIDPDYSTLGTYDGAGKDLRDRLISEGYDGIINTEDGKPFEYVAFFPNQIKSATDNNGDFSRENDDIRFSLTNRDYLDAVRRGDMDRAQRMVDEAAERAFSGSVVRDKNGKLMPLYHGTGDDYGFTIFDTEPGNRNVGSHFGTEEAAKAFDSTGKNTYKVYLNIQNPWRPGHEDFWTSETQLYAKQVAELAEEIGTKEALNIKRDVVSQYPMVANDDTFREWLANNSDRTVSYDTTPLLYTNLRRLLEMGGHDGVVYRNNAEDAGNDSWVALYPWQIKSAEAVTYFSDGGIVPLETRFTEGNGDIRFSMTNRREEIFFSNAERSLDAIKQEKGTPDQWLKMIEKAGGLKAGEDKWIGLSDWLKGQDKKSLTKQEIADYIRQNMIRIEEVNYADVPEDWTLKYEEQYREFYDQAPEGEDPEDYAWDQMKDFWGEDIEDVFEHDDYSLFARTDESGDGYYDPDLVDIYRGPRAINNIRKSYTTSGLKNNREIALTVPTIDPYNENDDIHFGDAGEGRAVAWIRFGETRMTKPEATAADDYLAEMRAKYGSVEGEETDDMTEEEISHLQSLTRAEFNATAPRVLVIDEIQSKRHQDAREKGGYHETPETRRLYSRYQAAKEDYEDYLRSVFGNEYKNGSVSAEYIEEHPLTQEQNEKINELRYAVEDAKHEYASSLNLDTNVPAAPFERNWHELAMKRMLRLAAEEGFDYVAWTTGDQQSKRYGLGKIISGIETVQNHDENGTREVYLVRDGAPDIQLSVDKSGKVIETSRYFDEFKGKELSEIVGKELAEKTMSTETDEVGNSVVVAEGESLNVGGEGMRGFYDEILPRFMNKYGKKWGVKVEDITLPNVEEAGRTMHAVKVTPEMRESVMGGQPMFSLKGNDEKSRTIDEVEREGLSPVIGEENRRSLYRDAYRAVPKEILSDVVGDLGSEGGLDIRGKFRNYLRDLVDGGTENDETGLLRAMINRVRSESGIEDLSDNEVRYMLWRDINGTRGDSDVLGFGQDMLRRRQWVEGRTDAARRDEEYSKAVESGDMEKAERMFDKAVKDGMPDTKVVDKDGNPLLMYHGTTRAGFNVFKPRMNGKTIGWFTTSKDDADSYAGNPEGKLYDPREKASGETIAAGSFALGDHFMFDSQEDLDNFVKAHPGAETYITEEELDEAIDNADTDEEINALEDRKEEMRQIERAYSEYERNHLVKTSISELLANPDAYTLNDFKRAWYAIDSNASFDGLEYYDAAEQKGQLADSLREYIESPEGEGSEEITFDSRVPRGGEGVRSERINHRTYAAYINMTNPYIIDAKGRHSEFESGDIYEAVKEVFEGDEYDGVLIKNWRVGRHQKLGDVAVPRYANQIKSANPVTYDDNGNLVPLSSRISGSDDIRFSLTGSSGDFSAAVQNSRDEFKSGTEAAEATRQEAREELKESLKKKLNPIVKAMRAQKKYDQATVNGIVKFARETLKAGGVDSFTSRETNRLLTLIKGVNGKTPANASKYADQLLDLVLNHVVKDEQERFGKLVSVKDRATNQSGVETLGKLDLLGQASVRAFRESMNSPEQTIEDRLVEASDLMTNGSDAVKEAATAEYLGLELARDYRRDLQQAEDEATDLANELERAKQELKDGTMSRKDYNEFEQNIKEAIRENKMDRIDLYRNFTARLANIVTSSTQRAKAFRDAEKQRIEDIHHDANRDMQGVSTQETKTPKKLDRFVNSGFVRFFAAPLATFDQMLRVIGRKNINGEGALWQRFMPQWAKSSEDSWKGFQEATEELDRKAKEIFGDKVERWSDIYQIERKMPKAEITFLDGGEMRTHELSAGNLLYIYMVNKMTDGRMKLRKMGIDQAKVDEIVRSLDPRFIEIADWLQSEYLVQRRNKYNAVHERMFGAPMADIEDYFPLKILKNARIEEVDAGNGADGTELNTTVTGAIIKRKRNSLALDLLHADAFSLVIDHVEQMERWAAFAEFRRDTNTLLSYKRFRNQLENMKTIYGSGETLRKNFVNVVAIAGESYKPKVNSNDPDAIALNISKGVTAGKINFRIGTAIKQILSAPAFLGDASAAEWGKALAHPGESWNWCMENLPLFEKRWKSRKAGDVRLMDTKSDWTIWRNNVVETASRWGMSPNAFVDALTVATGAKAVYETKLARYLDEGYSQERAHEKARLDATIVYNQSQQSSEGAFTSALQLDRTFFSVLMTTFRNGPMGYQRQLHDAARTMGRLFDKDSKEERLQFMAAQREREGLDKVTARAGAEKEYDRQWARNAVRVVLFGMGLQYLWNIGLNTLYLMFGDDDKKKKKIREEALIKSLAGPIEGLTAGSQLSGAWGTVMTGGKLTNISTGELPIESDVNNILRLMGYDTPAAISEVINLMGQAGFGFNPSTFTDAVVAVVDACKGDFGTAKEIALLMMRIAQVPQSTIDEFIIDELGVSAGKAKKMTARQIADRYIDYKLNKSSSTMRWAYSEEEEKKRRKSLQKKFDKKKKEREDLHKNK